MKFRKQFARRRSAIAALLVGFLFVGQTFAQTTAPAKVSATETELTGKISVETIKNITAALSADDMQGRGTMQSGGDKAADYIAEQFKKFGLKPLGDKGTFFQKIDFKESVFTPDTALKIGDENLQFGTDFAVAPFSAGNKSASGEMVFVGYAMVVDQMKRNDLGDVSLQGKFAVIVEGPPADISKSDWTKARAQQLFIGNLFRKGVAGIVIIAHGREDTPVSKMIDYSSRRQISLENETDNSANYPPFVYVGAKGAEKLFSKSGTTLKDALASAETNAFKPVKLNQKASVTSKMKKSKGAGNNVVGYLEGSDPKLKEEAVLFSAHYDGYGMENGKIYHGAADNALGVAEILSIAEAYSKLETKPKRSLVFLAVTGEEYGLFGSKHWAKKPTWDIKKVAANLNLDGIGTEVYAPVKTFVGFGAEHSSLGAMLADISGAFGIKVIADPMPDEKIFYRSDHYSFVERGVPALMLLGAPEGDPQKWIDRSKAWEKTDYHDVGDTIKDDWDWTGAKTVANVMAIMSWRVSETEKMPEWLPSSRFAKLERGNTKDVPEEK